MILMEEPQGNPSEIIFLDKVSVFQDRNLVLNNVQLTIDQGEFVYLIGKTGSGKSSLLKLLYGEIPAVDGTARVADYDLRSIRHRDIPYLRRKLGIVFQDFQLLTDRSVNENLAFVMRSTGWTDKEEMQKRMQEVLDSVGLGGQGLKMPHQLSGGEQQRVAIARALINHPEIILADEPTGNLDPNTSEDVLQILIDISKKGTAVFMATHDYSLFRRFPSRTVRCEDGLLLEKMYEADPVALQMKTESNPTEHAFDTDSGI
jgi:cell division transport system ATP-binding protein